MHARPFQIRTSFVSLITVYSMLSSASTGEAQDATNDKYFQPAISVAPSLAYAMGTTKQQVFGGSALISEVHSTSYCDNGLIQFGIAASSSDTTTTSATGTVTSIDENDLAADVTHAIGSKDNAKQYLGLIADFYGNNSVGLGLQQTVAAQYQYYFGRCPPPVSPSQPRGSYDDPAKGRWFGSVVVDAGLSNQRLYKTPAKLNDFALPVSFLISYLRYGDKVEDKIPGADKNLRYAPKFLAYVGLGYRPVFPDMHAYQISGFSGVQIPTGVRELTVNLTESDLYLNNAPVGTKRNYQSGTVSLVFSIPPKPLIAPAPSNNGKVEVGACYGGDKLQRLYCYDNVTASECLAPNLFRQGGRCTSPPAVTLQ